MKFLLIYPPETSLIRADNPTFLDEDRGANPQLGILYIAAIARQQTSWEVEVIDCIAENLDYNSLGEKVKEYKADLCGISALTFNLFDVIETITIVKKLSPTTKIILGGPHVHIYPRETVRWKNVDYVAVGEGEMVIPAFLKAFPIKDKMQNIPGLLYKDSYGNIKESSPCPPLIQQLDALPFPARDLTDINLYSSIVSKNNPITTMITSRGCPYHCSYCDRPNMGKIFRFHSADYVIKEMRACQELGIKEIFIYDDTFTVNRKRVIEICKKKVEEGIKIAFDVRARVDNVDEKILRALKEAGCERIHFGVEAGTEKIQKILNKGITLDQVEEAFKLTKKVGIKTLAYFMIGSPTETIEDIKESIKFSIKLNPDFLSVTILTPFPETSIYRQALNEGVIPNDYFKEFARYPTLDFTVKYWEQELSRDELFEMLQYFYKKFYGRPSFIIKKALQVRSFKEFGKKFNLGLKVLGICEK
ncbi:MAG: radical SAM protein [Bacteriovoracaceae bacterium]|nr:radical SAM protein [Bacteriovoracaceae bacterium]